MTTGAETLTYETQYRPGSRPVWLTSGRAQTVSTVATMGELAERVLRDTLTTIDPYDSYEWRVLVWSGHGPYGTPVVRTERELL
ncbi:hypothetical protein [Streptomyces sp. NPDC005953]|uniref:hypothetical protein n=1 Tax=Streptomyces sp. NPDC005953 TaxID=3156719 RepID=UPI0033EC355E